MKNSKYRLNAGAIVFNREGKVLIFARADFDGQWQFPQGGIEAGEKPQAAALRELKEETNICSVIPAAAYPEPLRYDFPPQILEKFQKLGRSNIGQEQYWFLFYFTGSETEIDFRTHPEEIEFKDYQWIEIEKVPDLVVDFKKDVYRQIATYMKPQIEAFLQKIKCHG